MADIREFIESSPIGELIKMENVTDVSYNGSSFFYMDNLKGRQKASIEMNSKEVGDFIRQIANMAEKQFSVSEPILDISASIYRLNACHSSIVRIKDEKSYSFSIRKASLVNHIESDKNFMSKKEEQYLLNLLNNNESIVISGSTGSGKTELQKYLLSKLKKNSRIIIIDNVQELEYLRDYDDLDITSWQVYPNSSQRTFNTLIRTALRNNPDWLIISESRGDEMSDVLLSIMSGHPIITTIHAEDVLSVPHRIARLIQKGDPNQKLEDILNDVNSNFLNYVQLERSIDKNGNVHRYLKQIGRFDKSKNEMKIVFERKKNNEKD